MNENINIIMNKYSKNKWLFWVGAGISAEYLPLGIPLTKFSLIETCGQKATEKILEIWNNVRILIDSIGLYNFNPMPRLEAMLDEIIDIQNRLINDQFNFIDGLISFNSSPISTNHKVLANLLKNGSNIVTTNFDTCIQRAFYESSYGNGLHIEYEKNVPCYKCNDGGILWHIHGVVDDIFSIKTTINTLKKGLSKEFINYLDEMLDTGSLFLFLGYSMSDYFDVNPYFMMKNEKQFKNSAAIFIQHGNYLPPSNLDKILKCFGSYYVINYDTGEFLNNLISDKILVSSSSKKSDFNWEKEFLANSKLEDIERFRSFLLLGICQWLGINISLIDSKAVYKAKSAKNTIDKSFYHSRMAIIQRTQNSTLSEIIHTILANPRKQHFLRFFNSRDLLSLSMLFAVKIAHLEKKAAGNDRLGWDNCYGDMSVYCKYYIHKYIKTKRKTIKITDRVKIERLLKLVKEMGYRSHDKVEYINQLAVALRHYHVLEALLEGKTNNNSEDISILQLYHENASLDGWVGYFRDLAILNLFLVKFHNKYERLSDVRFYLDINNKISLLIGDNQVSKKIRHLNRILKNFKE
jgi:hypothetical protein